MSVEALLLAFCRLAGFFLISPLLARRGIPQPIRIGLALAFTLLLFPALPTLSLSPSALAVGALKEVALGYLIGFLFATLIEAAALGGQVVGTLMGLSATELLNPLRNSDHPLMGRAFVAIVAVLGLALDLHHLILRLLYQTFRLFPLAPYPFGKEGAMGALAATSDLFTTAFHIAWVPFSTLFLLILLFALAARMLPDFPIFWTVFPIQTLVGLALLALAVASFADVLTEAFASLYRIAEKILLDLHNST